jgi:hypothetical protein
MAAGSVRTMRGEGVSFGQMKKPSPLALDAGDRTIGDLLVSLAVQRHPDRKTRSVCCLERSGFRRRARSHREHCACAV